MTTYKNSEEILKAVEEQISLENWQMLAYSKSPGSKINKKYNLQSTQPKSSSQIKHFNYSEFKFNERKIICS